MKQATADRQSETYACLEVVDFVEDLEDTFAILLLDAYTSIGDDKAELIVGLLATHLDTARFSKLDSVINQVREGTLQAIGIGTQLIIIVYAGSELYFDSRILLAFELVHHAACKFVAVDVALICFCHTFRIFALREFQHFIDDGDNLPYIARNALLQVALLLVGELEQG